jgi:hypothetical protein
MHTTPHTLLRINYERPTSATRNQDAVFNEKGIGWHGEESREIKAFGKRNSKFLY